VAIIANDDYQGFYGCKFLGFQDILDAKTGQQYYKYCYIEGLRTCLPEILGSNSMHEARTLSLAMQQLGSVLVSSQSPLSRLALAERSSKGTIAAK